MIYKQCIDACFDAVKACDRYCFEHCKGAAHEDEKSKECCERHCKALVCAEVCNLVGRLTAKGLCHKELYELCAKVCEDCADACKGCDNEYVKDCAAICKKCADSCHTCKEDCKKCEAK